MDKSKITDEKLYYLEQGKVVFTPDYHMARGHCCGSKCRHCPYDPKYVKGNINLEEYYKNKQNGSS